MVHMSCTIISSIPCASSYSPRLARSTPRAAPKPSTSASAVASVPSSRRSTARLGFSQSIAHDRCRRGHRHSTLLVAFANALGDGAQKDARDDVVEESSKRASVQLPQARRRVQMTFTCNKCDGKTQRMINPDVLEKGTMWVQCGECEAWHQIVDNLGLIFDLSGEWESDAKDIRRAMRERRKESED
mmetsp:Transcript_5600/g.20366  ORF Transcript_5600/g.20366 Transcript_5600/m.20366 type:complete len:187 (-) Transcript_5600:1579-2139(-)